MPEQRVILPTDVIPRHYALCIEPDRATWTFRGDVSISLTLTAATTTAITCNSVDLKVLKAELVPAGSADAIAATTTYDEKDGTATFTLASPATAGDAVLRVEYTGIIGDNLCGYYRAKFGDNEFLGTTQFEAVDARRALPCWDEPAVKSTFQLTLVVNEGEAALSNTAELSRSAVVVEGDTTAKVAVVFQPTPKMSTYLLAWTHGALKCIETTVAQVHSGKPTTIRVFATGDNAKAKGEFALEVAARCLPLYEKFFGSDYVLDKCDLIAIPDFAAGAMENWGLITYRESSLLCDAANAANRDKAYVAIVVAHELAHQWFGNLVTMQWWRELWLNEAFATWVEYWAVDTLYPEMKVWTRFIGADAVSAFDLDAMLSSHPIEVDINRAEEVDAIFDAISYCKGCCVLRMVINFIGLDAFQRGVAAYLKEFELSNATTVDLWRHLGAASGRDLPPILSNWTGEQGYPWIKATLDASSSTLGLEQHRFLSSGIAPAEHDTTIWPVPLLIEYAVAKAAGTTTTEIKTVQTIFDARTGTVALDIAADGSEAVAWVRVNKEGSTFCRVLHAPALHVAKALPTMSVIDRMTLAGDVRALTVAGIMPAVDAFEWLGVFAIETDPCVLKSVIALEGTLKQLLPDDASADVKAAFNKRVQATYAAYLAEHSLAAKAGEDALVSEVRGSVLSRLVRAGDAAARTVCTDMWAARAASPIAPDLRAAVYACAVEHVDGAYDELKAMHAASTDNNESVRCLRALRDKDDEKMLRDATAYALSDAVRSQDRWAVLAYLSHHASGEAIFVELVTTRWAELWESLPPMILGRLVQIGTGGLVTAARVDALEAFFAALPDAQLNSMRRNYQQGAESARNTIAWIASQRAAFVAALVAV